MELTELFVTLAMNAEQYVNGLSQTNTTTKNWSANLGKMITGAITAALAAAAVAITVFVASSLAEFQQFQTGMAEVFTLIPGASQAAMGQMEEDALAAASAMGRLPDEVVPALYQSLSAGVPPDNVFEFLEVANAAAIGGVTDLETAVDGITSVVNAYGSEMIDAAGASDLMFTAVRLGKTNFEELSGSLFNVIPTAASLGLEFENVTAALAVMTAQGTPTSVATTQLRQLLVELSKAGSDASLAFEEMAGTTFPEFTAAGGDLQTALQYMEQAAAQGNVRLSDLFGSVEAGNAALALTGANTESFTNALAEMANATGATDAAAAQFEDTLGRQQAKLEANISVAKIAVGEGFAPLLGNLTEMANELVTNVTPALGELASVLGEEAIVTIDSMIDTVDQLVSLLPKFEQEADDVTKKNFEMAGSFQDNITVMRLVATAMATPLRDFPRFSDRIAEAGGDLDEVNRILNDMQGELTGTSAKVTEVEKPLGALSETASLTYDEFTGLDAAVAAVGETSVMSATALQQLHQEMSMAAGVNEEFVDKIMQQNGHMSESEAIVAAANAANAAYFGELDAGQAAMDDAIAAQQAYREAFGSDFQQAINASTNGEQDWTQALFDSASQMGLSQQELVLLAAATGNYTDEQIQAALKTAAMTAKVQELAAELAAGETTVAEATAELASFESSLDTTIPRMTDLSGSAADAAIQMDGAKAAAMGLTGELNNIPRDIDIRITQTIETNGQLHEAIDAPNAGGGGLGGGGYALGGYTGSGPLDEIASFVHRNEFVLNPAATAALGVDFLNRINQNPDLFRDSIANSGGGAARDYAPSVTNNVGGQSNYNMQMQTMAQPADVVRVFRHMEKIDRLRNS